MVVVFLLAMALRTKFSRFFLWGFENTRTFVSVRFASGEHQNALPSLWYPPKELRDRWLRLGTIPSSVAKKFWPRALKRTLVASAKRILADSTEENLGR